MPGQVQKVRLGAGTKFRMKEGEEYIHIPGITTIGDTGSESPAVERNALEFEDKQYIPGLADGDDRDIVGEYENDANQKKFRDAAKNREIREFQIEYPNGVKAEFTLALLGFRMNNPEKENILSFTVKSKVNGETAWTDATLPTGV